jgi:[ribosomal protein S18]-alanine N-acetyltransferase
MSTACQAALSALDRQGVLLRPRGSFRMALEIRIVAPEWEQPLADFFAVIRLSGERYFHPHPFTDDVAIMLAQYSGKDLYYVLVNEKTVLAYGLLRGWEQGHDIPSLGIVVHPEARGLNLGEAMMHFLHVAARRKGAYQVRLRVYGDNIPARRLYAKMGYRFDSAEMEGQLAGTFDL